MRQKLILSIKSFSQGLSRLVRIFRDDAMCASKYFVNRSNLQLLVGSIRLTKDVDGQQGITTVEMPRDFSGHEFCHQVQRNSDIADMFSFRRY